MLEKLQFCNDKVNRLEFYLLTYQKHLIPYFKIYVYQRYNTYGLDCMSLNFIYSYLKEIKQRTKIGTSFSS